MLANNITLIIIFYLLGSLPFALILTKIFGYGDIRNIGSGNVGATNVLRTGNKFLAFGVLCLDVLKGLLPFLILNSFFENIALLHAILLCHFSILGHIFPVWLKFKGGKGVATYIGFLFGINYFLPLYFIILWLFIAIISKYSSLSSIMSLLLLPIIILLFYPYNIAFNLILFALSIFIISRHYSNILRLLNKTENKIRF